MSQCLFCQISRGEIPAKIVKQTDQAVAFHDLNPQAPVHILVVPTTHMNSIADTRSPEGSDALLATVNLAVDIARDLGLDAAGYRLVTNVGENGGQSVLHLHLHLLGGRRLGWPPG